MNIDQPTKVLRDISVIVGIVIGGWFAMVAIFATREMILVNEIADIEAEIDTAEKIRDHCQYIEDLGERPLEKAELRRYEINGRKLDRLYSDLERKQGQLEAKSLQ